MPQAILFDFDGLIVDTETTIYECWAAFYEAHGESLSLADYKNCVGSDFGQFDPARELEQRTGKRFDWSREDRERNAEIRRRLADQDARPGVRQLIADTAATGTPLAVASSSSRDWVEGWLRKLDLLGHFVGTMTRDDVSRVKPSPELFLGAAGLVGAPPAHCLIFEDSENGLRAASAAGIRCAIVTNPVTSGGDFSDAVLESDCFTDPRVADLVQAR